MAFQLFTIGHSTHTAERFLELLAVHQIQAVADVRRFPGSRRFPQFGQDALAAALSHSGIDYHWLEVLGGRRQKDAPGSSQNLGLRNESFRNYADYMLTGEFQRGVEQLLQIAAEKRTAFMCSESVFWRCHRRLISDYLLVAGIAVQHIMPNGDLQPHKLTDGAKVSDGLLTYPPPGADQARLPFDEG